MSFYFLSQTFCYRSCILHPLSLHVGRLTSTLAIMRQLLSNLRKPLERLMTRARNEPCFVEEEKVTECAAEQWYPVTIGEVISDRYKVLGKLGWGRTSTVWLCLDRR